LPGLVANFALLLNIVFILALLASFHGTLTLPGIAGIILTIGMAVDANVLIYERIREERRSGKSIYAGLKAGYERAFLTIVDANLTTVITALVLYQFGTGSVRGFALTLIIGLVSSMFTAIFVTRTIFETMLSYRPDMPLEFGRLHIFQNARFNIIGKRRIAYVISTLCVVIGLASTTFKGGYALGIDFSGGTLLECHFEKPVAIEAIRNALYQVPVGGTVIDLSSSEIKQFGNPHDILIRVKDDAQGGKTADAIKAKLKTQFADHMDNEQNWLRRQEAVGPKIGSELKWAALNAIGLSLVIILFYIWWRFKHIEFGIGAIIALFHDVLITLGFFSLTDREISLSVVAALLTIVGYSLNDTIVIYDRIREDMALYKHDNLSHILNRANNECLSRTLITSGTTLLSVLAILLLGGQVIHDFALALFIGIIAGTYSSIYVATPLVLAWQKRSQQPQSVPLPHPV
jgi:SecD/SecF fusion protein